MFSSVDRDPRERVLTVAFYAIVNKGSYRAVAGDDAACAKWFPLNDLPALAFDHEAILKLAVRRLKQHSLDAVQAGTRRLRVTPEHIKHLANNEIFVFGSNLRGAHAGGAARAALEHFGAVWGQGVGLQGQSYAIPTMQGGVETIAPYVDDFIGFAKTHRDLKFYVTAIACGIAGFSAEEIAPLFRSAVSEENICLPDSFWEVLQQ